MITVSRNSLHLFHLLWLVKKNGIMQKTFIITKIVTLTCNYTTLWSSIQYFEVSNGISVPVFHS